MELIATDPPFNKGRDFHATPESIAAGASFQDRWRWEDEHQQWVNEMAAAGWDDVAYAVEIARTTHSDDMGAFLSFMAVRLLEMKRVLKPSGSIFLHCDPTASHYLKILMDTVFGKAQFRNEIVWHYNKWTNAANYFQRNNDIILFYADEGHIFNKQYVMTEAKKRSLAKGYNTNRVSGTGETQLLVYDWEKVDQALMDKFDKVVDQSDKPKGVAASQVWTDIQPVSRAHPERTGYPTQKPLALYERIIKATTNRGDIVLDPFAGCATTCVAAERLGRQWVGIDLWDKAHDVVLERLEKEGLANPQGGDTTLSFADITYTNEPPERDDQLDARVVPHLETPMGKSAPKRESPRQKAEIKNRLQDEFGLQCKGCDREFDHPAYLEVDHKWPKADEGGDEYENRMLLCKPCNQNKGPTLTLTGLRKLNKRTKFMRDQNAQRPLLP